MKKLKIATIVGTRPEIIRLSRVLAKLDEHCDHILIHTGQNYDYELNQIFFDDLNIRKPNYFLNSAKDSKSAANTIGNIISTVDNLFAQINPEALLVLGDTNSCLSVIPAKRRKIPIFHMEAGNRCFDQRVPEEINRKIVDHISDVNMTYSNIARNFLLKENLPPDMVIKTGSPMYEVLNFYKDEIDKSKVFDQFNIQEKSYFLVSAHREENIEISVTFDRLISILNSLANDYEKPIIVSTHPRTQIKIDESDAKLNPLIVLSKPLGFFDYVKLQKSAIAVLSDSGTINEESSILNFPALNIRETHERPEAMEEGSVMMVGLSMERVRQGLSILSTQSRGKTRDLRLVDDYSVPNVSNKVLRIIHSYTDYINRTVWKKY
jgi:UDP-N-acetylglucosamine 2-epimerase (non-hydrolysing)